MRPSVRGLETSSGVRIAIRPASNIRASRRLTEKGTALCGEGATQKKIAGGGTVGESEACLPGTAGVLLENIRLFEAGGGHG